MEPKQQEQQTRRNKNTGKLIIIVLMLIVITASLIFATWAWAKYSESFQKNATVDVAKWNITANVANESTWSQTFTHVVDQAIAPGTSGYIPIDIYMNDTEVCARYTISIYEATGNVPTNLRVYRGKYDATNGYGKLNANDSGSSLIGANTSPVIIAIDTIGVPQSTGTVNHTTEPTPHHAEYTNTTTNQVESGHVREYIYWEWPYETGAVNEVTGIAEGDVQDTIDGKNAITNPTMTIGIKIETEQINPLGETPYRITYNLDGGTLATSNPTTYILETSGFTLNNPSKTGYTFKGWSGTGLTGDTNTSVTIAQGSTGDRSYTANYTANTYYIKFNSNSGSGSMSNQTMTYDTPANLTANNFTRTGYTFTGWNTESGGTGTSYTNREEVNNLTATNGATINLYAQWEPQQLTKYAVQIYGINQDVDANGNTLGLTFGPAVGRDYNNCYITHEYEAIPDDPENKYYVKIITNTVAADGTETTSSDYLYKNGGTTDRVTRTQAQVTERENINLHDMEWAEIKQVADKTVFEDCMLCGDTKSVELTLNSTIASGSVYNQYGDGAGMLYNTISNNSYYYTRWNPSQSQNSYVGTGVTLDSNETNYGSNARNAGGYSVSHIRATLIGKNAKTNEGYAGDVNLTSDTCLYSCIESDLQAVITPKKIKYVTGTSTSSYTLNDDIADSIWLFSDREMYGTGQYSGNTTEGLGASGDGYNKFGNTESKYYISSYNVSANTNRVAYTEAGSTSNWLLRSPRLYFTYYVRYVIYSGSIYNYYAYHNYGLAFGFCIQ